MGIFTKLQENRKNIQAIKEKIKEDLEDKKIQQKTEKILKEYENQIKEYENNSSKEIILAIKTIITIIDGYDDNQKKVLIKIINDTKYTSDKEKEQEQEEQK